MSNMYILSGKVAVPTNSTIAWAKWMQEGDRKVKVEAAKHYSVSTVFLGLDHSYSGDPPVLFETMVFGDGEWSDYQDRYHTYDEAVDGHESLVNRIMQGDAPQ